ncbi:type II secretory pathway component PulK [Luteibacter sp. Sphag1AF]|uniref:hypothetical protein n=1 Tax=Luteibacter sp. Sphag1AF TaxID=2587031 RepID=UPI001615012E|nr:hypothetical protein [Luteibacter sp. Sphag1AF]MBB3228443.1 type II secretory pathway component PulK [Luteibacter sp. Sphag1AF]
MTPRARGVALPLVLLVVLLLAGFSVGIMRAAMLQLALSVQLHESMQALWAVRHAPSEP